MDITTLSLAKKYANKVAAGFSKVEVQENNLIFTLNDGTKATMTVPTPEKGSDGISIVDVSIDIDGNLLCHMSDGSTINAGKITEYDEYSQELNNKIIDTRNELERVKNDVLETGTDTDTYIHLEDSAMAEYQELSVDGVCEQETTIGKNLLNPNGSSETRNGITITNNGDGTFSVSGTSTVNSGFPLTTYTIVLENGVAYTQSVIVVSGTLTGAIVPSFKDSNGNITFNYFSNNQTKTTTDTMTSNSYNYYIASGNSINCTFKVQLEKSSSATSYEPYTGGQPSPSPDYPQEIKTIENSLKITSTDSNIFDITNSVWRENVGISLVGQEQRNSIAISGKSSWSNMGYMFRNVRKNTDMVLSADFLDTVSNTSERIVGITVYGNDNDNNTQTLVFISSKQETIDTNSAKRITCKFNSGSKDYLYIRFWNNSTANSLTNRSNLTISNIKLEFGDKETAYSELYSQITTNLPEGEFIGKINDTYKDTLKVEYNETDGQYHLNLYKRVYKNNSYNGESYNYYISTTARKDGNIECGELQTGQVVYYDGVETIIDLGIVDMPITYNEITNLFTDSDLLPTINAKYYRNFISTVRNLQVNEKALKQELVDINNRLSALETSQTSVASESEVV